MLKLFSVQLRVSLIKKTFARMDCCSTMSRGDNGVKKYFEESCSHNLYFHNRNHQIAFFLPFDTKTQQVWWVIIKSMTYFQKQFSKIIYFWWDQEGIWTYIFETGKSSFQLLAQPWSWCTKRVVALGASNGCIFFKQKWSSCVRVKQQSREE